MLHGYLRHHKHTPRRRLRAAGGGSSPPRRGGEQPGGTPGPCFTPTPPPQPRTHTHPPLNFSSRNPPALPWHKRWEGEVTSHTFLLGGKLKCFHFCAPPPPFFFSLSFVTTPSSPSVSFLRLGGRSSQKQIPGLCMESLLESSSTLCISNLSEPFIALISLWGGCLVWPTSAPFPLFLTANKS